MIDKTYNNVTVTSSSYDQYVVNCTNLLMFECQSTAFKGTFTNTVSSSTTKCSGGVGFSPYSSIVSGNQIWAASRIFVNFTSSVSVTNTIDADARHDFIYNIKYRDNSYNAADHTIEANGYGYIQNFTDNDERISFGIFCTNASVTVTSGSAKIWFIYIGYNDWLHIIIAPIL